MMGAQLDIVRKSGAERVVQTSVGSACTHPQLTTLMPNSKLCINTEPTASIING